MKDNEPMRQAVTDIGAFTDPDHFEELFFRTSSATREALALFSYIDPRRQRINQALDEFLDPKGREPAVLWEAMRYAVLGDGKRIRPLLCVMGAELCGAPLEQVLPTACAIELIHCFGLIHSDLPSIDGCDLRRSRPSCHVRFGESIAILAGDALFSRAFELIALQAERSGARRAMAALAELTSATGGKGMVAGQTEALLSVGKGDVEPLEFIVARRSTALIRAAIVSGAFLADGNASTIYQLSDFGEALGHAFHIIDDILAETGERETLGKPVKRDRGNGKLTYPALFGITQSRRMAEDKSNEALSALEGLGDKAEPVNNSVLSVAEVL